MNPFPQHAGLSRLKFSAVAAAVLVGMVLASLAVLLLGWQALDQSNWWFPETDIYQIWFLTLAGLTFISHRSWGRGRRSNIALALVWTLATSLVLAGLIDLMRHIIDYRTTGDFLQNYLEGARRAARGSPIYDLQGLKQGVNATPLIVGLLRPWAGLADYQAVTGWVAVTLAALGAYAAAGCLLVRRIKGRLTIPDAGLVLAGATTFSVMQHSWRLGQIDTLLLMLLTFALAKLPGPSNPGFKVSAVLTALATGLKVLPGLLAAPILLRAAGQWRRDMKFRAGLTVDQRWAAAFIGTLLLLAALSVSLTSPGAAANFLRNIQGISAGSTSGNNYSLASRAAGLGEQIKNRGNKPISSGYRSLGQTVAALTLILLALLTLKRPKADGLLLSALWLSSVPLVSPVCWNFYMLWCSFLP